MGGPAQYLQAGFILISVANLAVIVLLVVVFVLAVMLRRPEKSRMSIIEAVPDSGGRLSEGMAESEVP
jgi:predicted PurR-regulated permease PerM